MLWSRCHRGTSEYKYKQQRKCKLMCCSAQAKACMQTCLTKVDTSWYRVLHVCWSWQKQNNTNQFDCRHIYMHELSRCTLIFTLVLSLMGCCLNQSSSLFPFITWASSFTGDDSTGTQTKVTDWNSVSLDTNQIKLFRGPFSLGVLSYRYL